MLSRVFKAYDIRGAYPDALNEKVAWKVGYAASRFFAGHLHGRDQSDPMLKHVVVGRDMRASSPKLANALIEGLRSGGSHVFDLGLVDTSFVYFAINYLDCAGGIMTTASHNPPTDNGFKISQRHALPVGVDTGLVEMQRIAATIDLSAHKPVGLVEERDLWNDYADHVRSFLHVKRPLKVVVDASNGMASAFIEKIFAGEKNLKLITINMEANGKFVHPPNPLVAENMAETQAAVKKHKADFGVCFDGDADRCVICDENGRIIGCDILGALLTQYFLKQSPESAIVYDLRSSRALPEMIEAAGGTPVRGRVGHVFLKKLMRENNAVFGAELSGHMYYRDNFFTDSGAITFATLLTIASASRRTISQQVKPFMKYHQSGEQNFKVNDPDAILKTLKKSYRHRADIDELDGLTIDLWENHQWWMNVRKSNTEPMVRLNVEAANSEILEKALAELTPVLGEPIQGH